MTELIIVITPDAIVSYLFSDWLFEIIEDGIKSIGLTSIVDFVNRVFELK